MYGLYVLDFGSKTQGEPSFGNTADIIETRTKARIGPIHYGVWYTGEPLTFSLVFGSERALDRYDLEEISMWLTGYQAYQWLTIGQPDLEHVAFKCIIKNLAPIANGWVPVAFEAQVVCDCPYAYGLPFSKTYQLSEAETPIIFRNASSVREYLRPAMTIRLNSGETSFSIRNDSDGGRTFSLEGLPAAGLTITVDNYNCMISEATGTYNLYDYCNLKFFRAVPGNNSIVVSGKGELTISGRLYHNVGS